jgi:hypothetical protein
VRIGDGGAAVAAIAPSDSPSARVLDEDIDIAVLAVPGAADRRIDSEVEQPSRGEALDHARTIIALSAEAAEDPAIVRDAERLAQLLGGQLVRQTSTTRALAPELCVAIGAVTLDIAGATTLVRIGGLPAKHVAGALDEPIGPALAALVGALRESAP